MFLGFGTWGGAHPKDETQQMVLVLDLSRFGAGLPSLKPEEVMEGVFQIRIGFRAARRHLSDPKAALYQYSIVLQSDFKGTFQSVLSMVGVGGLGLRV